MQTKAVLVLIGLTLLVGCGDDAASSDPAPSDAGGDIPSNGDASNDGAHVDDASEGPACPTDEFAPWAGGASYYAQWANGPSSDPSVFPLAVWLQAPTRAAEYQGIGVNLYIGLWQGPTEPQLAALAEAQMPAIAPQNAIALANLDDPLLVAWSHTDEPDNAQPDGAGGYGPCVLPGRIQDRYAELTANDPTRPVYLNLGQGVINDEWVGRGTCTDHDEHYPEYIAGADIVSFDIYPVTSSADNVSGDLAFVPEGVSRMREWAGDAKPVWTWIETTHVNNPDVGPTPSQVRSEVWLALIHGAMGIGYFAHEFQPSFVEAGLLADAEMASEVAAINAQITELAPVLNTRSVLGAVVTGADPLAARVSTMVKRFGGETYLFAGSLEPDAVEVRFTLTCVGPGAGVDVLGEDRSLTLQDGVFDDHFDGFGVHIYRIR